MEFFAKTLRQKLKLSHKLAYTITNDRLYITTGEPKPAMILRKSLLKIQDKLLRFKAELQASVVLTQQKTEEMDYGTAIDFIVISMKCSIITRSWGEKNSKLRPRSKPSKRKNLSMKLMIKSSLRSIRT